MKKFLSFRFQNANTNLSIDLTDNDAVLVELTSNPHHW
ncbi:unnamed protein product [Haemonchus placei]|uniref:Ribosomal protein L23 n=1 Tax=Haemonchus placei TaxID=6290 RepID=A0A0N4VXZ7_HAEPC|nr:unnamed protein product [Haemonchus placei]